MFILRYKAKLNIIFYAATAYSFVLFLLPSYITWGVYTPNVLGWSMIITFIIAFLIYLILFFYDLKRNKKKLKNRSIFFFAIIALSILYWFYESTQLGNI